MSSGTLTQTETRPVPDLPPDAPVVRLAAPGKSGTVRCETRKPVTLIGSRRDLDLPVNNADVSRVHCALVNTGRTVLVCDLSSRTGTFINDEAVRIAMLRPGDALRVGPVAIETRFDGLSKKNHAASAAAGRLTEHLSHTLAIQQNGASLFELTEPVALIGRRSSCDVALDTPDVSLTHALVFAIDGCPAMFDLGSRSGTFLNGTSTSMAWIHDGDVLGVGGVELSVKWAGPTDGENAVGPEIAEELPARPTVAKLPGSLPPAALSTPGDLQELERIIAGVYAQISASRAKLDEQTADIARREEQLATERAALLERERSVQEAIAGLSEERRTLDAAQADYARRAAALADTERSTTQKLTAAREREAAVAAQAQQHEQREAKLAQRQDELQTLAQSLTEERGRLETQRATLDEQSRRIEQEQAELAQRAAALSEAEQALQAARQETERRQQELEKLAAELSRRQEELTRQRSELDQASQEHTAAAAVLAERETEVERRAYDVQERENRLAARESEIVARSANIEQREAKLAEREATEAQANEKLSQFKAVMQEVSARFAEISGVPNGGAPAPAAAENAPTAHPHSGNAASAKSATESGGNGAAKAAASAKPNGKAHSAAKSAAAPGTDGLPAPMVDQPLFTGPAGGPPKEWPPEMQERFRVLRRVSKKSDDDLRAQVMAEAAALTAAGREEAGKKKSKRRWWA